MIADISLHREELQALCRRFHVRRLALFGSAAREDFDPARSDLDFLVEFEPLPVGSYADTFFRPEGGIGAALRSVRGCGRRRIDP